MLCGVEVILLGRVVLWWCCGGYAVLEGVLWGLIVVLWCRMIVCCFVLWDCSIVV